MQNHIFKIVLLCWFSNGFSQSSNLNQKFDCSSIFEKYKTQASCSIASDPSKLNKPIISVIIDLQPLSDTFHQSISEQLNQRSCRKRINVNHSKLIIKNNKITAIAEIWIEKRLCEKGIKSRLFESTNLIELEFSPQFSKDQLSLNANVIETGFSNFEIQLLRMIGKQPRLLIENSLNKLLSLNIKDLKISKNLKQQISINQFKISNSPPQIELELAAEIDFMMIFELVNSLIPD